MNRNMLAMVLMTFLMREQVTLGQTTPKGKPSATSGHVNTVKSKNFFEPDEDSAKSFSAKVKIVREIAGDTEIMFADEKLKGVYVLPNSNSGIYYNRLVKSSQPEGMPVMVTVDENRNITKVEFPKDAGRGAGSQMSVEDLAKKIRGK
jgi:hypothetical protein